ncbi:MAG: hypothetical protein ABSF46_00435 [Terriglobia bacterium]|jgi:hypothetical protein
MPFTVGITRRVITPPWGVELAGLGYYLQRTWQRIRDDLTATALVVCDENGAAAAIVAADLMYNDKTFVGKIREQVAAHTDIPAGSVCVNFSHSHNAPTAGFIRGAGVPDPEYLQFVARQISTAVISAYHHREPARLYAGGTELAGMTYNRTRDDGPVDTRVSVLRADRENGQPLAIVVNFHAHPVAHMEIDLRAVSRDVPGEVVDQLEAILAGATAMYLQGTCGDVMFGREYVWTDRRFEPARAVTGAALKALACARPIETPGVKAVTRMVTLPTRRWRREEIMPEREEGLYRLKTGDTTGWLDGMARVVVGAPERLPLRYGGSVERAVAAISRFAVEWTEQILPELDSRPERLDSEVQAIRIGDAYLAAHGAELFSTLGLGLRQDWPHDDLFVLGYSNGTIGYMPDKYDIERRSYAAITSPKFIGQFPFTPESGPALIGGIKEALRTTEP